MTPQMFLAGAAALALLSACVSAGTEPPAPTPETLATTNTTTSTPSVTPTPLPSPSPSPTVVESFPPPPADETAEQAAIREGWMNYWGILDGHLSEPFAHDLTGLNAVTIAGSKEATAVLEIVSTYKERNWQLKGSRQFRNVSVAEPDEDHGTISSEVTSCHDGNGLSIIDATSGVPLELDASRTVSEVMRLERDVDGAWRVTSVKNEVAPC